MWMNWPDMNTLDLQNKNPAIFEQKQNWDNEFQKALQWLKVELPKTIPEQEKEVYDIIINETFADEVKSGDWKKEDIVIKYIKPWVFSFVGRQTWNVNYFINWKWKIILALWEIEKNNFFIWNWKAFKDAWYIQKEENWKYNMYKVIWTRKNWEDALEWPIDIYSPEYYKAWQDILFYSDILTKYLWLKKSFETSRKLLGIFIEWWSFKFEDLELFKQKWMITPEDYIYWVEEMKKVLVSQCGDARLIKLWIWIKESDLKKYTENNMYNISPVLALECYRALPEEMRDLTKNTKE